MDQSIEAVDFADAAIGRERRVPMSNLTALIFSAMPPAIVASERAAALLRTYLDDNNLHHYRIAFARDLELHDLEQHLRELDGENATAENAIGEPSTDSDAKWECAPPLVAPHGAEEPQTIAGLSVVGSRAGSVQHWQGGFLRLRRFEIVVARWFFLTPEAKTPTASITLAAAPSVAAFSKVRTELTRLRRRRAISMWQVVKGYSWADDPSISRDLRAGDELILSTALRERVSIDVLKFFSKDVAKLYRNLSVPHRRGVLLYGPPGNGKTSLIRWIGASVPEIPAMLLRPRVGFDSDDLEEVVRRWQRQAPALLVIEDLDWLIKELNVSTFLNLLDGIDTNTTENKGGLLLIATTNHPEKLDPAINNRPGRFDVLIEVPSPDAALRRQFLERHLPTIGTAALAELVRVAEGFSFAHLHEVLRLSGLFSIFAEREARSDADVVRAANQIANAINDAYRGFIPKPEMPFGLEALRVIRTAEKPAESIASEIK